MFAESANSGFKETSFHGMFLLSIVETLEPLFQQQSTLIIIVHSIIGSTLKPRVFYGKHLSSRDIKV